MATVFSGNTEKTLPKTYKDCYKADAVSQELWAWCEKIETFGTIFLWIIIILGVSLSFGLSMNKGVVLCLYLLITTICAVLEHFTFHLLALLVGSLASIVQHTKISADVALFTNKPDDLQETSAPQITLTCVGEERYGTCECCQNSYANIKDCVWDDNGQILKKALCNKCLHEITKII